MLFSIGTRVKLIHTGDEGIIRKLSDDDMVVVFLESIEMEIPVLKNDLELIEKGEAKEIVLEPGLVEKNEDEPSKTPDLEEKRCFIGF